MLFNFAFVAFGIIIIYIFIGAVNTYIYRLRNPFNNLEGENKSVYLTFDDGMNSEFTPKLLDLLDKEEAEATFFIMASTIKGNEDILNRIKKSGHTLALHSYDHKNQILQLPHQIRNDFIKSIEKFENEKVKLKFYRPPWGHIRPYGLYLCKKMELISVHWTVIVGDWKGNITSDEIYNRLRKEIKKDSVVCLHDGRGTNRAPERTIEALKILIPELKKEGYRFENIDSAYKKNTV